MTNPRTPPRWLKPATDIGPIAVFFVAYLKFGLLPATAALIAATAAALLLSLVVAGRVPLVPLVTAGVVGLFGGLTILLNDETFIKLKPTIVQGLFALVLFGGFALGRSPLKRLFGTAWSMDDTGWRWLGLRFAGYFAVMALLNEIVWRTQTTDFWVSFKVFGIMGLTMVFTLAQMPLIRRHRLRETPSDGAADG